MTLVAAAILSASTVIGFGCYTDLALGKETNTVPGHHVPASLFSGASANQCARPSIAGNMPSGVSRLLQQGLDCPTALVLSGALLVVANAFGGYSNDGYVAEFDTATGKLVRVISGPAYRFDGPGAMAVDGAHIFVADFGTYPALGSVTEFNSSTGVLVGVLPSDKYSLDNPDGLVASGADLFVANSAEGRGGSVTEFNAASGALVRVISGAEYGFEAPGPMAISGANLFVLNRSGSSVTEIDASTGKMVKVISGSGYHFAAPGAIVVDWPKLFVANSDSVTEFQASG